MIDYEIISQAINYYKKLGYKYVDLPWYASKNSIQSTLPEGSNISTIKHTAGDYYMVGSAEQAFFDKITELEEEVLYCSCTPCFRDEEPGFYSVPFFLKLELFAYGKEKHLIEHFANKMIKDAEQLFLGFGLDVVVCDQYCNGKLVGQDLLSKNIELGSYGVRCFDGYYTAYGTGLAEPRFSMCLPNPGYHLTPIFKSSCIEDKILEEAREFEDAILQNNKVMALVELSDLFLAIQQNAEKLNISLDEIKQMALATNRAFKNKRRF